MRGVPRAAVTRLPGIDSGLRWPSWPAVLMRGRRRGPERPETVERLRRQRRLALTTGSESQLSRRWLRRF